MNMDDLFRIIGEQTVENRMLRRELARVQADLQKQMVELTKQMNAAQGEPA
jgi:hypothetical protein